jgi:hypothetical protein
MSPYRIRLHDQRCTALTVPVYPHKQVWPLATLERG